MKRWPFDGPHRRTLRSRPHRENWAPEGAGSISDASPCPGREVTILVMNRTARRRGERLEITGREPARAEDPYGNYLHPKSSSASSGAFRPPGIKKRTRAFSKCLGS